MDNLFQQIKGRGLYDYQKRLFQSNKKFKIVNKSRQVGISYALACWGLLNALLLDKTVLIVSPSERQSKHVMDYVREFLNYLKNDFEIRFQEETKLSYIFKDGGALYSLPNNPNTVRGFKADLVIIDEFAHFLNNTDKEMITAITPSISRGGEVIFVSTPFGTKNMFYEYWHNKKDYEHFTINYKDCPDLQINPDDFDDLTFQQEYNNQFLEDSDESEFPFDLIRQCINPDLIYEDLQKNKIYLAGADIGRTTDLTALVVFEKQQNKYVLRMVKTMKNTPYVEQEKYFTYLLRNYTFEQFMIDETGIGNMLAENLRRRFGFIQTITFNNENKQKMVTNLKLLMQKNRVMLPNDAIVINSIRMIKRKYTPTGYLKFESDRDSELGHGDVFWAMALALYNAEQERAGFWIG